MASGENDGEIGFWLGVPYWGQGLISEAVREILRYAFEELHMQIVWAGFFDGNENSKRVQEKCGFVYHHTESPKVWELTGVVHKQHIYKLTKEQWKVL